jgi:hypothetical protein
MIGLQNPPQGLHPASTLSAEMEKAAVLARTAAFKLVTLMPPKIRQNLEPGT